MVATELNRHKLKFLINHKNELPHDKWYMKILFYNVKQHHSFSKLTKNLKYHFKTLKGNLEMNIIGI